MSFLIVCPLAEISAMASRYSPSHMVSLVSADTTVIRPEAIAAQNHLFLPMNDITHSQSGLERFPKSGNRFLDKKRDENNMLELRRDSKIAPDVLLSPELAHVQALIDFAQTWVQHPAQQPLLIHCWLGISRSTAAGFIIACALAPKRREQDIADYLRDQAPFATPNARLVALADEWLARQGRMIEAIRKIGRGAQASCGEPFILNHEAG